MSETLMENINGIPKSNLSEDCCLIENSFIEELEKINNLVDYEIKNVFSENNLRIIKTFEDAIKSINEGIKITLINKKIIELMGFNNNLNNCIIVNYYGGNKKLIIEYKISKENKAFLINDPFNDIEFKSKTYIIINNQSKILYHDLLFETNDLENNNKIISFLEYIMNFHFFDKNILNNNKIINNDKNEVFIQNDINKNNLNSIKKNNHENNEKKLLNKKIIMKN